MSRRDSAASRSSSSRTGGARTRTDGKVDVSCPQCGAQYRVLGEKLSNKLECSECHRVFIPKTTAGKRAKAPDHTKVYVGFGIGALALVGIFVALSMGGKEPVKPKPVATAPATPQFGLGDHPRATQLVQWANGIAKNDAMLVPRYTDIPAAGKQLGVANPSDIDMVSKELQANISTRFLRELDCASARLASTEDMTAPNGKGMVYVTPREGDDNYKKNTRGEIEVTFRMEGDTVKVTGWTVKLPPIRAKADPLSGAVKVYKDIAKPEEVEIKDSAGTRKVMESKPTALPHWDKATPEQQKMADEIVAEVIKSADPDIPNSAGMLTRATLRPKTLDDRRAVVPRLLNAMFENYGDVVANNMKLSQLNRAMVAITGFSVNYQVEDTGNAEQDKKERESCVRQWYAFWWRNAGDISRWLTEEDTLEPSTDDSKKPAGK